MTADTIIVNDKKLPWLMIGRGFKIPSFNYVTETETIPGRDGQVIKNRRVEAYDFEIPLIARNDDFFRQGEQRNHDDILNEVVKFINYDKPVKLKFESQDWYWYALFEGPLEVEKRPFSHIEFTIKVKVVDPYKYSDDEYTNVAVYDQVAIVHEGTAKTYPIIKAKALKDSTSFMITKNDENYFQVGEAETATKATANLNPTMAKLTGNNLSGIFYETAGEVVSHHDAAAIANGSIFSNGYIYKVKDYGTRSSKGWHGPALKKSFSRSITDFTATADMKVYDAPAGKKGAGKVFCHLYDEMGNVMCSFGLLDASGSKNSIRAWFGIYNDFDRKYELYDSVGGKDNKGSAFDDAFIHFSVSRINNIWMIKTWAYYKDKNGKTFVGSRMHRTYKDTGKNYDRKVAQVGFQMSKHTNYPAQDVAMNNIKVVEHQQGEEIPYIIKAGDEVYIDMKQELVLIDGNPALEHKTLGSDYFSLDSQLTELFIFPQNTFDTTVYWQDRYL